MKKITILMFVCCLTLTLIPISVSASTITEIFMEDFRNQPVGELPVFPDFIHFNPHVTAEVNEVMAGVGGNRFFRMSSPYISATGQSGMESSFILNVPPEFQQSDIFVELSMRKSASYFATIVGRFAGIPLITWGNLGTMNTEGTAGTTDWGNAFGNHNPNFFITLQIRYLRNANGHYNAFVFIDQGGQFVPVRAVANMAADHGSQVDTLNEIVFAIATNNAWANAFPGTLDFDFIRVFAVDRPTVARSNIEASRHN